ncbi:streptococcal hemagglutinin-like isoform X2 [Ptychodera flava]|uniref:streptococcal hemagglutinin-like isoform X2 n=1 Tax=Ptychodera flava TaxID=63121 RepID=UPI00396A6CA4
MFCLIHDIMHDTAFNSRKTISAITDFTNAIKGKYKLYKRVHQCLPQACFVAILQCIEHQISRNDIDILTSACFFRSIRTMTCDLCWTSNKQIDDTPLVASLVSSYTRFTDAIKNATINAVKSISECKKSGVCTNCNERVKKEFSKHTVSTPDTFMFKPWFDSKSPDGSVCVYSQVSFQDIANEKARHEIQGLIVSKRMPGGKEEYQAYVRQSKGFARLPLCSDSDVQTSLASIELDDPVDLKLICWKKVPNIPSNSSQGDPTVSSVMSSASTLTTVSMRPGVSETQLTSDGGKSKDKPYQKISSVSSKWEQKGTSKGHSLSAKSASPAVPAPVAPSTLPSTAVTVAPSTAVTVAMTPSPWASRAVTVAPSTAVTVAVTPTTLPSPAVTVAMAPSPWASRTVTVAQSPWASRTVTVVQSPGASRAVTVAMAPSTVPSTTVTVAPSRAVTVAMTTSSWTSKAMTVAQSPWASRAVTVTMAPSTVPSTTVTVAPSRAVTVVMTTSSWTSKAMTVAQSPWASRAVTVAMAPINSAINNSDSGTIKSSDSGNDNITMDIKGNDCDSVTIYIAINTSDSDNGTINIAINRSDCVTINIANNFCTCDSCVFNIAVPFSAN